MPEHQNIEYKESWRDEYLKWICGFANAQGGKIFIGIDDKGKVSGLVDHKKLMEDIPNKVVSHLGLVVDINLRTKTKKHYIEIAVKPSEVAISYHGVYHYRSGSTKQELKGIALQEFLLKKMGRSWDDMPVPGATLKDIDEKAVKRFIEKALEQKRISGDAAKDGIKILLSNLHLINEKGKIKCAAILLFGKDPLKFFTHAYFKIGRFGQSDHDLKFQDVIEGNIFEMIDKVIQILHSKYLTSPIHYEGIQRKEELEYPEPALREAILNAIVHKNYAGTTIQLSVYDDKLILWNPGAMPYELSIEQLKKKHSSYPRNKNIADIFFKAGYIEAWGRGTNKILDAFRTAGLPEPDFVEHAGGIQTIFLKDIFTEEYLIGLGLDDRHVKALVFIKQYGKITNTKYQELLSVSKRTATNDLQLLFEKKLIAKIGTTGKGTFYILQRGSKRAIGATNGQ
ncbi:MAG: ATP-binding protein [Chitinophagaceae bacterium]